MSTIITTHCKMGIVDPSGNVNVLYPQTTGSDVSITPNATIKSTTLQGMVDEVAALNSDLSTQISNLKWGIDNYFDAIIAGVLQLDSAQENVMNRLLIRQCAHVISIWGYLENVNIPSTAEFLLGTLENISAPADVVRIIGNRAQNAYTIGANCSVTINTRGEIRIACPSGSGNSIFFNCSYIR